MVPLVLLVVVVVGPLVSGARVGGEGTCENLFKRGKVTRALVGSITSIFCR